MADTLVDHNRRVWSSSLVLSGAAASALSQADLERRMFKNTLGYTDVQMAKLSRADLAKLVGPEGPNLLTLNQAGVETDATGWQPSTGAPTLARSTAQFLDGAASLSITATAVGPALMAAKTLPTTMSVIPGKTYKAKCSNRAAVTGRNCQTIIRWETAASVFISNSNGNIVADSSAGWTESIVMAVAPATAAYGIVITTIDAVVVGEVHYVDRVSFKAL